MATFRAWVFLLLASFFSCYYFGFPCRPFYAFLASFWMPQGCLGSKRQFVFGNAVCLLMQEIRRAACLPLTVTSISHRKTKFHWPLWGLEFLCFGFSEHKIHHWNRIFFLMKETTASPKPASFLSRRSCSWCGLWLAELCSLQLGFLPLSWKQAWPFGPAAAPVRTTSSMGKSWRTSPFLFPPNLLPRGFED